VTIPYWSIVVTGSAKRQLADRLPEVVAAACIEFLSGPLAANPHRVGAPLGKPFEGQWRARRGTYRVRHRIDETTRTVYVLDVEHRRDAYRS
jgi:mRNA-degrading endonuclease RelE of RelBE toxin-antitoxin system